MILLAGADLVLPDRVLPGGSLLIDGDRIAAIEAKAIDAPSGATRVDLAGSLIVPGFVDVHVHGVEGFDVLEGRGATAEVAARLPRYGVTSFCPTSIACGPTELATMLTAVRGAQARGGDGHARVVSAHLESNFISSEYLGAQPASCVRRPPTNRGTLESWNPGTLTSEFTAEDILSVIDAHREQVGIITLAPEIEGGIDLVRRFVAAGHRVSIGHSGATYEAAMAAIEAGVSHATHLFNRMTPMSHRAPGIPGAVLQSEQVRAEIICDGYHVHPAVVTIACGAKGAAGIMAITDGTAGSGLAVGSRTRLGGRTIIVTNRSAELEDGTLAGSTLTMDGAFRTLVQLGRVSLVDAAHMCATTPAAQMGLRRCGRLAVDETADLVVLDSALKVRQTYLRGRLWRNPRQERHV